MRRVALLSAVALLAACGGSDSPGTGYIRLAHLSFGAPAVDFCWAPQGSTTFAGPAMRGAGDATGLTYAQVSRYFTLTAGAYTVRLVPFAAASCATAVPGVADVAVTAASGGYYTVAAAGIIGQAAPLNAQLKSFTDEAKPDPAKVIIRFVNALPGSPALDLGTGAPTAFAPIFSNLAYLSLATPTAPVDANGYASIAPAGFSGTVILTTCLHGLPASTATCPTSVTLPPSISASITGGTVASAFLIAASPTSGELLLCGDSTGTVPGTNLSACIIQTP
jgi:hypothetical protein